MGSLSALPLVRPASPGDARAIHALLAQNGLSTGDLDGDKVRFWVASDGQEVIGVVGLELHGAWALLRSLAVADHRRGRLVGRTLCERAAAFALQENVRDLYLLTNDAEEFFAALGFRTIGREQVPDSIRGTAQFKTLCPASAICMTRRVSGE